MQCIHLSGSHWSRLLAIVSEFAEPEPFSPQIHIQMFCERMSRIKAETDVVSVITVSDAHGDTYVTKTETA